MGTISSIPTIFKGILTAFLTVLMVRITYPVIYIILNLFEDGTMMKYAAIITWYLVLYFVTWVLIWMMIFKAPEQQGGIQ